MKLFCNKHPFFPLYSNHPHIICTFQQGTRTDRSGTEKTGRRVSVWSLMLNCITVFFSHIRYTVNIYIKHKSKTQMQNITKKRRENEIQKVVEVFPHLFPPSTRQQQKELGSRRTECSGRKTFTQCSCHTKQNKEIRVEGGTRMATIFRTFKKNEMWLKTRGFHVRKNREWKRNRPYSQVSSIIAIIIIIMNIINSECVTKDKVVIQCFFFFVCSHSRYINRLSSSFSDSLLNLNASTHNRAIARQQGEHRRKSHKFYSTPYTTTIQ